MVLTSGEKLPNPSSCFNEKGQFTLDSLPGLRENYKLDPGRISILSWNIHKGNKKGWQDNLRQYSKECDIIALQEGYLTKDLTELLVSENLHFHIAHAFSLNGIIAGTLTASKIRAGQFCSMRNVEPISGVPKSVLITRYPVKDRARKLLLVNLHMINFTLDSELFRSQLQTIADIVQELEEPFIITGDFNTWNEKRKNILAEIITKLSARKVAFREDHRSTFWGNHVDHIYYKGLEFVTGETRQVSSSDHNPMMATFRLVEVKNSQ